MRAGRFALNRKALAAVAVLTLLVTLAVPVRAARPLLDSGKWDNYFALFARNASVPWKRISVRLDTFSGAGVDFAAYDVDPADVLVAGANARPRAVDTSHRTPVAKWRFTPPAGLQFQTNDVEVPLQNHEGFYVVEARRGDAVQQVWLNVSRVGLITKESAAGSIVYGADLGTGRALRGMRVTYLVGVQFAYDLSDGRGISRVPPHARFALAEWGKSRAFVSFLPLSPLPAAVVGVRADRAAARGGEHVRVIGFARRRTVNVYAPATGEVNVVLNAGGKTLTSATAPLDRAGAFTADLVVPADAPAGDAAVLATAAGASGGATVHIDATGDVGLTIGASCTTSCPAAAPIPLTVTARHGSVPAPAVQLRVVVVRTPHVFAPGVAEDAKAWGTTTVADRTVATDDQGQAKLNIPAPGDGLASTYGVTVSSGASTATTRLIAPTARLALAIVPDRDALDVGEPAAIDVRGFDPLDGSPAANAVVQVKITHGPTEQVQTVTLDANGDARATFRDVALGMNLVSAQTDADGRRALDVAAITVAPRALTNTSAATGGDVAVTLDHPRYRPGERVTPSATLAGAEGDALLTIESASGIVAAVVSTRAGAASTALVVPETIGTIVVGAAFVRDGALVQTTRPIAVDGPGHQRFATLTSDHPTYAPGATAKITIADGGDRAPATLAIRVSDRLAAGGASFDDVGGLLAASGTTTQNTAAADPPWHAYVAPARSTAGDIFGSDRPTNAAGTAVPIAVAAGRVLTWRIDRVDRDSFDVALPLESGRYVLAIVKMTDDGDVGTASLALTVQ